MILTASRDKTIIMWTLTRDDVSLSLSSIPVSGYKRRRGRQRDGRIEIRRKDVNELELTILSVVVNSRRSDTPSVSSTDTTTSSLTLSFRLTVNSLFPPRGTRPFVFGTSTRDLPPVVSLDTPRTFSPSPSPPITVKSFPVPETEPSSSGTLSESASSTSKRMVTPSGFRASGSPPTP